MICVGDNTSQHSSVPATLREKAYKLHSALATKNESLITAQSDRLTRENMCDGQKRNQILRRFAKETNKSYARARTHSPKN
jgi:hypothetical protein